MPDSPTLELHLRGRGRLVATVTADRQRLSFRIDDYDRPDFWCEFDLDLTQIAALLAGVPPSPEERAAAAAEVAAIGRGEFAEEATRFPLPDDVAREWAARPPTQDEITEAIRWATGNFDAPETTPPRQPGD